MVLVCYTLVFSTNLYSTRVLQLFTSRNTNTAELYSWWFMILYLVVLSFFFTKVQAGQLHSDTQLKQSCNILSLPHLKTRYSTLHPWISFFSLTTSPQIKHRECILPSLTSWIPVTVLTYFVLECGLSSLSSSQSMKKQFFQNRIKKQRVLAPYPCIATSSHSQITAPLPPERT